MKQNVIYNIMGLIGAIIIFAACTKTNNYQKQVALVKGEWFADTKPEFEVEISDTTQIYDLFLLLRHNDAYDYSNMWIRVNVQGPGDSVYKIGERLEVIMADAEGKWLGRSFGDIWEQKIILSNEQYPIFTKSGVYKIKMEQLMRTDPLKHVLNVGVNIQKRAQ